MKLKATKFDVGDTVLVKGPRPGLKRNMTIEEIQVTVRARSTRVRYGFKESLWLYSEAMLKETNSEVNEEQLDFFF